MFVVRPAPRAELLERHALRIVPLVFRRCVIRRLAGRALKPEGNPVFPLRHVVRPLPRRNFEPSSAYVPDTRPRQRMGGVPQSRNGTSGATEWPPFAPSYDRILVTTPAPTVRPPSRIANRNPSSTATGTINSISNSTLSPGITISTPSGNVTAPVTSVVRM